MIGQASTLAEYCDPCDWALKVPDAVSRLGIEDARRRILRKLHIRWWHAGAQAMQRLLDRAGVPKQVIDIIPSIVDTCKVCRAWTRPLPASVASVDIPDEACSSMAISKSFTSWIDARAGMQRAKCRIKPRRLL